MMSLFTSFDVSISPFCFFIYFFLFSSFLSVHYKLTSVALYTSLICNYLQEFFSSIKPKTITKFSFLVFTVLAFTTFFLNFFSVFSFNFALSSQVSVVLSASLMVWLGFMTFFVMTNIKGFLSHCVPEGTPIYLVLFLFLIEIVSNLIRPLTLTVRLVANILAGHLLMILLSKMVMSTFVYVLFYAVLNFVEIFVALIQAYIFVTMTVLYYSELE